MAEDRPFILTQCRLAAAAALFAALWTGPAAAQAPGFDGITIVDYSGGSSALGDDVDYIVTFVSPRGSYGAAVPIGKGSHAGCFALGSSGAGPARAISFGIDADIRVRRQGLETICPVFTLSLEEAGMVRVELKTDRGPVSERRKIIARIPWRSLDFSLPHLAGHDIKGVRLGPAEGKELGPLPARSTFQSEPRSRYFQRQVGKGQYPITVQGKAAAREITGWPTDVLYFAQYLEEFEQKSTTEAFHRAVLQRYGEPTSEYPKSGYMLWLYDLDGQKMALQPDPSNSCRETAEFWLKYDLIKRVHGLDWDFNRDDLGPWGCSLVMELNPNRSDGGISGYTVKILSGYAMAVNHFSQRIAQVRDVMKKVEALQGAKPRL